MVSRTFRSILSLTLTWKKKAKPNQPTNLQSHYTHSKPETECTCPELQELLLLSEHTCTDVPLPARSWPRGNIDEINGEESQRG